jgi:hypothetical protein
MRTAVLGAWVGAGLTLGAVSIAEGSPVAVRVDVQGSDPCSSGFLEELEARDPNVRAARPNELAPLLTVRIGKTSRAALHGRLVIVDSDGTATRREVDGDTCESVLGALALMSAIAVDPSAPVSRAAMSDPTSGASGEAMGSSPTSAPAGARSNDAATPSAPSSLAERSTEKDSSASPRRDLRFSFAGGAEVSSGIAPTVVLAIPAYVDMTWGKERQVAPLLRGGYLHGDSGDDTATGGSARFVLNSGTLDVCARLPFGRGFEGLPCFHAEGGSLAATGLDITPAENATRPWASLGALAAIRYHPFSPVFAELSMVLRLPLVRDRFYFEPDTTVFRPPALSIMGGAFVGVTIP